VSPEFRENGLGLCHQNFERTDWVCVTRNSRFLLRCVPALSRERTGLSCWGWIELDVQFCGGAHHDPVVITIGPWSCHFLVYVANVFCLEAAMLSFF
jgi:hypothetical protein